MAVRILVRHTPVRVSSALLSVELCPRVHQIRPLLHLRKARLRARRLQTFVGHTRVLPAPRYPRRVNATVSWIFEVLLVVTPVEHKHLDLGVPPLLQRGGGCGEVIDNASASCTPVEVLPDIGRYGRIEGAHVGKVNSPQLPGGDLDVLNRLAKVNRVVAARREGLQQLLAVCRTHCGPADEPAAAAEARKLALVANILLWVPEDDILAVLLVPVVGRPHCEAVFARARAPHGPRRVRRASIAHRSHNQEVLVVPRKLVNLCRVRRVVVAVVSTLPERHAAPP
mmetsp:Transcript_39947/g.92865  ORF Transcript_39947/g.92865 Transcript_39947/m.92865 type:complete len:283 (-) Transcript_39947:200-1048(-)